MVIADVPGTGFSLLAACAWSAGPGAIGSVLERSVEAVEEGVSDTEE